MKRRLVLSAISVATGGGSNWGQLPPPPPLTAIKSTPEKHKIRSYTKANLKSLGGGGGEGDKRKAESNESNESNKNH